MTPLHCAGWFGKAQPLRLLLDAGADVHAKDNDGLTPLHSAAEWGNAEALRILLAAGADAQAKDNYGGTPLHSAAGWYGNATALAVLLATGARINERNAKGETALDLSTKDECRQLLRQAGGKTGKELAAEKGKPAPDASTPAAPAK